MVGPLLTCLSCFLLCPDCPQVEKAEQDKQSAIIRAQGEAQSAMLIGQAVQQVRARRPGAQSSAGMGRRASMGASSQCSCAEWVRPAVNQGAAVAG